MSLARFFATGTKVFCSSSVSTLFGAVLIIFIGLGPLLSITASAQEMQMECETNSETEINEVQCDFQFSENQALEELTFTANDEVLEGAEFTPYSGLGKTSAFLFLVDTSNPNRANTVKRNLEIVKDQMRFSSATRLVGLATFANKLDLVFEVRESHSGVDATLASIEANGAATEFFSSSLEAIKVLKGVNADRRALVIMSDGKAEDTAYNRNDVVSAAEEAGVTIIGLGFAERQSETPSLQEIRRLAEETGGYFTSVVSDEPFASGFLSNLPRYIENGGVIKAPLGEEISGDVKFDLVANTGAGNTFSASQTLEVESRVPEEEVIIEEPGFIESIYQSFDGVFEGASKWAANNQALALILLLLPILILGVILFVFLRTSRDEVDYVTTDVDAHAEETVSDTEMLSGLDDFDEFDEQDATRAVMSNQSAANGYLEVVGSEDNRYSIDGHSVSIGRHSDNDIRLSNDSVHRHHAHLSVSTDGVATIHDLDTANGLVVNGTKVDKKVLQVGDIVEFGEVRLRFMK